VFIHEFLNTSGSTLLSASCAAVGAASTFTETKSISLMRKWNDGRNLSILIDIPAQTGAYGTSAYLDFALFAGHDSGTTFEFTTSSGTSLFYSSGTSVGGISSLNIFRPITIVLPGGTTEWLRAMPYVRLSARSREYRGYYGSGTSTTYYHAKLVVG